MGLFCPQYDSGYSQSLWKRLSQIILLFWILQQLIKRSQNWRNMISLANCCQHSSCSILDHLEDNNETQRSSLKATNAWSNVSASSSEPEGSQENSFDGGVGICQDCREPKVVGDCGVSLCEAKQSYCCSTVTVLLFQRGQMQGSQGQSRPPLFSAVEQRSSDLQTLKYSSLFAAFSTVWYRTWSNRDQIQPGIQLHGKEPPP